MQYSIVNYRNLERTNRIDSEFYQSVFLDLLRSLRKVAIKPMTDLCKVSDGNHMSVAEYFQESGGVPYYRGQDINTNYFLEDAKPIYIPEGIYEQWHMRRSHFHRGDVLLSIVGTVGSLSLVTDHIMKSTGSCKLAILRPLKIRSEYLSIFLMCKYGNMQIKRNTRGAVQTGLLLEDMDQIYVFTPDKKFEDVINQVVKKSILKNRNSKSIYSQAEQILLSELGLLNWQPKHHLSFVKNYSDTDNVKRIDAEYFQPKYDEIVKAIKSYTGGYDTLGNLVKSRDKNFTPLDKTEYKYIELSNIASNGEITDCMVEEGQDLPSRARRKVAKGDVIVSSIEGSLSSIALIEKEYDEALCSTGFHVINSKHLNSETLLVLLKSMVGQLQFKKGCSGTILTAINQDEFKQIILPIISDKTQKTIQQKITESFNLRKQSKHLLECAKRAVEIAIEQNEDAAIKWLHEQTKEVVAINSDKWQNKNKGENHDKGKNKKSPAKFKRVAKEPRGYKQTEETISGEGSRLGGKVHGIREGTGEYDPAEGASRGGEDSTRPVDSTRYFETAQGTKTYSEVAEIIAVSVTKTIEAVFELTPKDIHITPEWVCNLHHDIAFALFPDWAGHFRVVNVKVGKHTPPPFYEVPVHMRMYCDDLAVRLASNFKENDIVKFAETLAFADWRFQWIHPFRDFNGRVGRIIMSAILYMLRLPPAETASPETKAREEYLNALRCADVGDISSLTKIWMERLSKALEKNGRTT